MRKVTKFAAIAGIATMAIIPATAAFASSNPVPVSATVDQSITVTGLTGAIVLPAGNPGTNTSYTAPTWSVTSNDSNGATAAVNMTGDLKGTGDGYDLTKDNGTLTVSGKTDGTSFTPGVITTTGDAVTELSTSSVGSGVDTISDVFTLAIPANAPAENYSGQVTYYVVGN